MKKLLLVILLFLTAIESLCFGGEPLVQREKYVSNEIIVKFRKDTADAVSKRISQNGPADRLEMTNSLDGLNKRYRLQRARALFKDFKKNRQRMKDLLQKDKSLLSPKEHRILRRLRRARKDAVVPELDRIYKLEFELEKGQSIEDLAALYNEDAAVEYAELNYIVSVNAAPDDPCYPVQWALNNTGQMYPESGKYRPPPGRPDCDIDAPEGWDIAIRIPVVVGVADTGVDFTHRDLVNMMWVNSDEIPGNEIDDDDNGYVDDVYGYDFKNSDGNPFDDHGHGTHCSGIIAAETNNGLDIAGVSSGAKIMALKFIGSNGSGKISDAVSAFYYAIENGVEVISNSWGGEYPSTILNNVIEYADSQGVIVIAAAGNEGNSKPYYPAYYNYVISVAATDSNDDKPSFSNYGSWVDVAAPGVDILSLRADGTSMGTVIDAYTTVASGTSMACPHVAGICAVLLGLKDQETDSQQIEQVLRGSTDPIAPGICASGRVNLYQAIAAMSGLRGHIELDKSTYSCSDSIDIELRDGHLIGDGVQVVIVTTNGGDLELVLLWETGTEGIFTGSIATDSGVVVTESGIVELADGQLITVSYYDSNDGFGNPAAITEYAISDCAAPVVKSVYANQFPIGPEQVIMFDTNEPTTARVFCGTDCSDLNEIIVTDSTLSTFHSVTITDVEPFTEYFFEIEVTDSVGNVAVDQNCLSYFFTTNGPNDIRVPADYPTIQEAIDYSWPGGRVLVADGTYTGSKNKNIDFGGKVLTLQGENGPEDCIIDCEGSGKGFNFHNQETADTIVQGFTITNANNEYGTIYCYQSGPMIIDCIITGNNSDQHGGINCVNQSNPIIDNCVISDNGGVLSDAVNCEKGSNPVIINCVIVDNFGSIAIRCKHVSNAVITNCIIARNTNSGAEGGTILCGNSSSPTITNCTITDNTAIGAGGVLRSIGNSSPVITNSILWQNNPGEISLEAGGGASVSYSNIQGGFVGTGNVDTDPRFINAAIGDYHLRWTPLCVDGGLNEAVESLATMDIEGNPRALDGNADGTATVDMGAYEYVLSDIQWEIINASEGDTIVIAPGIYYGNIDFEGKNLTVRSWDPNDPSIVADTVILGEVQGAAVTFANGEGPDCILAGFTITGADEGIYCYATNPRIIKCVIDEEDSIAAELRHLSKPDFQDCTISGEIIIRPIIKNITAGGIYDYIQDAIDHANSGDEIVVHVGICDENIDFKGKNLILRSLHPRNPTVADNTIIKGYRHKPVVTFANGEDANCVIAGLTIKGGSTGIYCSGTLPAVNNCLIIENKGYGLELYRGFFNMSKPTITNSLIAGNYADGLFSDYSRPKLVNCTIASNQGFGVNSYHRTTVTIQNCIIRDNADSAIVGDAVVTYSNVEGGFTGTGNIDTDPCFVNPNNSDYHLMSNSPCIDAGDPGTASDVVGTIELDGYQRFMDADGDGDVVVDIGAYEAGWYFWSCPYWGLGDLDGDGFVSVGDVIPLINYYGQPASDWPFADADKDGWINANDVAPIINNFGAGDGIPCP